MLFFKNKRAREALWGDLVGEIDLLEPGLSARRKWAQKARVHAYIHTFVRVFLKVFFKAWRNARERLNPPPALACQAVKRRVR